MHRICSAIVALLMSGVPTVCVACVSHHTATASDVVTEIALAALDPETVAHTDQGHRHHSESMSEPRDASVASRSTSSAHRAAWAGTVVSNHAGCSCCVDVVEPVAAVGPSARFAVAAADGHDLAPPLALNAVPSAVSSAPPGGPPGLPDGSRPPSAYSPILRI